MMKTIRNLALLIAIVVSFGCVTSKHNTGITEMSVGKGWASNTANTVIFRKNSIVSNKKFQYVSYYDQDGFVVIAKRKLSENNWQITKTPFKGVVKDAHKSISIHLDKDDYIHLSWGMHNEKLNYARSTNPNSLTFSLLNKMTGLHENNVTYPEFYRAKDELFFVYRDGGSGNGNLVLNHYDTKTQSWKQIQSNLIDGEHQRNAYWQMFTDKQGNIHVSWVWRESPDVASNHDMSYAVSKDGGVTWQNSKGENYTLPITMASAEKVISIPQNSELINQTSMAVSEDNTPYICSYWKEKTDVAPQYHIIYRKEGAWHDVNLGFRKANFSLSGMGTKRIPISRPQIITWGAASVGVIYRDQEKKGLATLAYTENVANGNWQFISLSKEPLGMWEPSFDTERWKSKSILDLFVQKVDQVDGEGLSQAPATDVNIIQWKP